MCHWLCQCLSTSYTQVMNKSLTENRFVIFRTKGICMNSRFHATEGCLSLRMMCGVEFLPNLFKPLAQLKASDWLPSCSCPSMCICLPCHWHPHQMSAVCWPGRNSQLQNRSSNYLVEANSKLVEKLTVRERPGKYCFRFWQEGPGFDRNIFSSEAIAASIDYIHMNPVKRGLCEKVTDWKWSSARFYLNEALDPDLPDLTRPDPSWFEKT